jgi:hypothetical protein
LHYHHFPVPLILPRQDGKIQLGLATIMMLEMTGFITLITVGSLLPVTVKNQSGYGAHPMSGYGLDREYTLICTGIGIPIGFIL